MNITFAGMGVMGAPMAGHLVKAGHAIKLYNRTYAKAQAAQTRFGGEAVESLADAVRGAEILILCVGNDADVRAVVGEALPLLAKSALVIDHTTTSADVARELDALAQRSGRSFIDAPVSGGQAGAEAGRLSVMAGGDEAMIDRARPVLAAYAAAVQYIGPSGAGQLAKMVNQICIAGVVQGLAEAVHFAKRAGLDTDAVFAAVSKGAAQSWQMQNRWGTMAEGQYDFGFAVDWMRKDLGLVLDAARHTGARLPLTALVDQFYADVQARGGRRWDTSSLLTRLEGEGEA